MSGGQDPLNALLSKNRDANVTLTLHNTSLNTVKQQYRRLSLCIEPYTFRL